MMENITITSWNCYGLKNKREAISQICRSSDLVALQETLLWPHDLTITDSIHPEFNSHSVSSMQTSTEIVRGRPHGGLSFLWKRKLDKYISVVNFDSDRLLGLKLHLNETVTLFVNVYMPYELHAHLDEHIAILGTIQSAIQEINIDHVCIIGDSNAHPTRNFYAELLAFCNNLSLSVSDVNLLPPDSFSYYQSSTLSSSWLDHCITSEALNETISICKLLYEHGPVGDHIPLQVSFKFPTTPPTQPSRPHPPRINWQFDSPQNCNSYLTLSETNLRNIAQPAAALLCNDTRCCNTKHKEDLAGFYSDITNALLRTGSQLFNLKRNNARIVPGWNEYVAESHQHARSAFITWREMGSPRNGPAAVLMRRTRAHFKLALKYCRANEAELRATALSNKLATHNHRQFWKDLKSTIPMVKKIPLRVGDAIGADAISQQWADHFSSILNCINDEESKTKDNAILSGTNPI